MALAMEMVATTATLVRMLLMFPKVRNEGCVRSNSTLPMTSSATTLTSRRASRACHVLAGLSRRTPGAAGCPLACSSSGCRLRTACSFAHGRGQHHVGRRIARELTGHVALVHGDHAVAQLENLGQLRRDQHDGHALFGQPGDQVVDL